eukprot:scaffold19574_cov59-Phaeocystis_antarctica.AAC.1
MPDAFARRPFLQRSENSRSVRLHSVTSAQAQRSRPRPRGASCLLPRGMTSRSRVSVSRPVSSRRGSAGLGCRQHVVESPLGKH